MGWVRTVVCCLDWEGTTGGSVCRWKESRIGSRDMVVMVR